MDTENCSLIMEEIRALFRSFIRQMDRSIDVGSDLFVYYFV